MSSQGLGTDTPGAQLAEPRSQADERRRGAVSSIGRIAQDAEGVGQRPDAWYVVDGGMTARRFAARSSPSSDGGKGQALMFPSGATTAATCVTGLPIGSKKERGNPGNRTHDLPIATRAS